MRLKSNPGQKNRLAQAAGSRRFIYNCALNRWQEYYKQHGKTIPMEELSKELTQLKHQDETSWLQDVDFQL